jgi:chromatin segregation and condensation protein Rec8/ScpA/Scc1 (kleisin family)
LHGPKATGAVVTVARVATVIEELELDLEVFTGPFDLLLTLVLREEVDLLEVELADVVVSYLDVLEARGELDLEVATEFLVLIAALLELKSRLMLPSGEEEDLEELAPGEAAEELLARMLDARRYRSAAEHLAERLAGEHGYRYRSAPPPAFLRRVVHDHAAGGRLRPRAARRRRRRPPAPAAAHRARAPDGGARDRCRAPGPPARAPARRGRARSTTRSAAPTG